MPKDEEHIIDWILERTSNRRQKERFREKKRAYKFENRKFKIDRMIHYCEKCLCCWSYVTKHIDASGWGIYPRNNIPSIGKERKECPNCEKISKY